VLRKGDSGVSDMESTENVTEFHSCLGIGHSCLRKRYFLNILEEIPLNYFKSQTGWVRALARQRAGSSRAVAGGVYHVHPCTHRNQQFLLFSPPTKAKPAPTSLGSKPARN